MMSKDIDDGSYNRDTECEDKTVRFKSKEEIRWITQEQTETDSDCENFVQKFQSLETIEQINNERNNLLADLDVLEEKLKKGFDVCQEYKKLQLKLKLLKDIKNLVVEKNELEKKIPKYNGTNVQRKDDSDERMEVDEHESNSHVEIGKPTHLNGISSQSDQKKPDFIEESERLLRITIEKLFCYLTSPNFEVFICIDSKNKFKPRLCDTLRELANHFNINVSVIGWSSKRELYVSPFKKVSPIEFSIENSEYEKKSYQEIRSMIAAHKWTLGSKRFYIYLESSDDKYKDMVISKDDNIEELIRYHSIERIHISTNNHRNAIDNIGKAFKIMARHFYCKALNNLKRCLVNTEQKLHDFIKCPKIKQESTSCFSSRYVNLKQHDFSKQNWKKDPERTISYHEKKVNVIEFSKPFEISDFSRTRSMLLKTLTCWGFKYQLRKVSSEEILNVNQMELRTLHTNLIDIYLTAKILAKFFNKQFVNSSPSVTISDVYLLCNVNCTEFVKETYFEYKLRCLNSNMDDDAKLVLDAFSHFTYVYTSGEILVTDLKSIYDTNKKNLYLDEPVIFSSQTKQRFGSSDLGQIGIDYFLKEHICSDICSVFYDNFNK